MPNPRTEAVAKAIYEAEREQMGAGAPWERLMTTPKSRWMVRAQAAEKALIEALMEPTPDQMAVGFATLPIDVAVAWDGEGMKITYKAMLKAAGEGQ